MEPKEVAMIDGHRTLQVEAAAQREALKDRVFLLMNWCHWDEEKLENTIPETNSSPLKIDPLKRKFLLETIIFSCYVSFREGRFGNPDILQWNIWRYKWLFYTIAYEIQNFIEYFCVAGC